MRQTFLDSDSYIEANENQNQERLLLVGVMTAQKYVGDRALEIWRTWAKQIPGKVIFFVAEGTQFGEEVKQSKMPIYTLKGVDDSYPPQKKSFAMLRWMFDNYVIVNF